MCIRLENYGYNSKHFIQSFSNHYVSTVEQGNYVACPLGAFFMLCTLLGSGGAKRNTSFQIGKALQIQRDGDDESCLERDYRYQWRKKKSISIANAMYTRADILMKEDFESQLVKCFDQQIYKINFRDQQSAMETINEWPQEIHTDSIFNLFNIFHFKDVWEVPFMDMLTENASFEVSSDRQIQVPIMSNEEELDYGDFKSEGFEIIRKPFKNSRFSFIVMLPKEKWNLTDLSGITGEKNIYVTTFQQKDVIRVDETGIEAGSVANLVVVPLSASLNPTEFHVTHPFVCSIYDHELKIPLVTARVLEPT
ncbi:unnamed protein product [Heterobilharzia americana]|nr:unnamed protein product [Heterobilharzia americana]